MPNPRGFFTPVRSWEGEHRSYHQRIEGVHDFRVLPSRPPLSPAARLEAYNQVTAELQGIVAAAVRDRKSLRAQGSSWSLSKVGLARHRLLQTKALRLGFDLPASRISPDYSGDGTKLRFLESGVSIASVNRYLRGEGLSLKASGSNNGQTLAGVVSTGTHGSAFRFGATQDFVVGLHLVTGPARHVYLERASRPVVQPSFAAALGADLVRDDDMFDAALVSFGSFGIIHGMMIETRELFLLHAHRSWRPFDGALRKAISSLDFSDLDLPRSAAELYHFEVFFNPNEGTPPAEASVILMFEGPWAPGYTPPEWDDGAGGPGVGALEIMGELVGLIPSTLSEGVKPALNAQVRNKFAPYEETGTIGELFRGEKVRGKNLACGVGVPLERALDALAVAFQTYEDFGSVLPLLLSVRFVKGTKALLGFTRFERTCVLEIDAVNTRQVRDYLEEVWSRLERAGIGFTLHWGKINTYLTKDRVRAMYGDAVDRWKAARSSLLEGPEVEQVFTNRFLEQTGLAT